MATNPDNNNPLEILESVAMGISAKAIVRIYTTIKECELALITTYREFDVEKDRQKKLHKERLNPEYKYKKQVETLTEIMKIYNKALETEHEFSDTIGHAAYRALLDELLAQMVSERLGIPISIRDGQIYTPQSFQRLPGKVHNDDAL